MKKLLMALTGTCLGASAAYAQLDLNDPMDEHTSIYASELDLSGDGVEVAVTEATQAELGFTLTDAAPRFVRFDLTNGASYVGTPSLSFSNLGPAAPPSATQASGGDGEDFVLFEIAATTSTPVPSDSIVTLTFGAATPNLALKGSTTIQYQLFEFGAGGGNGQLASAGPAIFASFSETFTAAATQLTGGASDTPVEEPRLIDSSDGFLSFRGGGPHSALGSLVVADVVDQPLLTDGVSASSIGAVLASHILEVDGDFRAAEEVTIVLDSGGAECGTATPFLTASLNTDMTQAVFSPVAVTQLGDRSPDGVEIAATVCMEATGADIIRNGSYSATYRPVANSGFTVSDVPLTLGTLENTGSTVTLHLTLTPRPEGGVYANFFRISNLGSSAGRVTIRLINDLGESSAPIDMGIVYNESSIIPAEGSSGQFSIDDVYAAVQTVDPTFSVPATGRFRKLRTVISAEFDAMDVQTYSVSTDATTFGTF